MKVSRERYQHGGIRKVPRSHGFVWEFRFYQTLDGKRKIKVRSRQCSSIALSNSCAIS